MTGDTEISILLRLAAPELDDLSDESAEALLRLHFDVDDLGRITQLTRLSSEGRLAAEQRAELDCYLRVGHFLSIVQSKARVCLKQGEASGGGRQAESTTGQNDWLFNTNETWAEGAYREMLAKSVIALYGYPEGVGEAKLQRPGVGDRVFAFVNKSGVVAVGTFPDHEVFPATGVFDNSKPRPREFHRRVRWEFTVGAREGLNAAQIAEWGYRLPVRCTVARLRNREIGDRIRADLMRKQ